MENRWKDGQKFFFSYRKFYFGIPATISDSIPQWSDPRRNLKNPEEDKHHKITLYVLMSHSGSSGIFRQWRVIDKAIHERTADFIIYFKAGTLKWDIKIYKYLITIFLKFDAMQKLVREVKQQQSMFHESGAICVLAHHYRPSQCSRSWRRASRGRRPPPPSLES